MNSESRSPVQLICVSSVQLRTQPRVLGECYAERFLYRVRGQTGFLVFGLLFATMPLLSMKSSKDTQQI